MCCKNELLKGILNRSKKEVDLMGGGWRIDGWTKEKA